MFLIKSLLIKQTKQTTEQCASPLPRSALPTTLPKPLAARFGFCARPDSKSVNFFRSPDADAHTHRRTTLSHKKHKKHKKHGHKTVQKTKHEKKVLKNFSKNK